MNPFSKRIHQIKNPDLDLPKGTRNPFLDLKSVFGFTERNTPRVVVGVVRTPYDLKSIETDRSRKRRHYKPTGIAIAKIRMFPFSSFSSHVL